MNKMIVSVDDKVYESHEDHEGMCEGCAFIHDYEKCQKVNEYVSCCETFPDEKGTWGIVWKPYRGLINKNIEESTKIITEESVSKQDSIVAEIRELLLQRSETGIKKYSTTLDRKDLKPSEWCQHLLEELLDASGYVLRLKKDLEMIEALTAGKK